MNIDNVDEQLQIVEIDKLAKELFVSLGQSLHKGQLLDFFPELIGSEAFLKEIIQQEVSVLYFDPFYFLILNSI